MEIKTELVDFKMEMTSTSISNVATETENDITRKNAQNKSPVMLLQNEVNENPNLKLDVETIIKTEFPDFEIETTPTSIQYVAKETNEYSLEKYNVADETKINILTHGSALNKSPVVSLLSTENRHPNFELKEEREIKTEITDFEIETTPTTIQYVAKETEKLSTEDQLNEFENRSEKYLKRPYECETCFIGFFSQKNYNEHLLCHTVDSTLGTYIKPNDKFQLTRSNSNPAEQADTEMETKTELVDFKMEMTSTSISNVATETENDITQKNAQNKSPVMLLQNEVNENPNLKLDVETIIKTEFPDFEIETTPTSIQYVAKETNEYSLEKYNVADETKINILTHGSALNKSPVVSLLSTENRHPNFELKEEREIKTEITDFEIETTPTTIQYVAKETEKLSTEEQLIEFEKRSEKYLKRPYECETCFIGFFSQKNYDEHLLCHTVSRANGPACSMCDVAFATEQGFILHCRITHDELKPVTEKIITSEEDLNDSKGPLELSSQEDNKHNLVKTSESEQANIEQSNKCNICDKRFKQFRNLEIHKRLHTGHKTYECNICDKKFTHSGHLKGHERVHTGDKPYECNICDKKFARSGHLKGHERVHTGHKPYECNICDKKFTHSGDLKRHERVHTGHKPYECNICDKKFTHSGDLKRHEILHSGHKPYECNTCDKRFTFLCNLKSHERLHTGHKPYECKTCDKKFTHSGDLKRHERVHSGHKPYECNICDKKFAQSSYLKRHERVHTGHKPYECNICDKKFALSGHLKRHERVHSGDKP